MFHNLFPLQTQAVFFPKKTNDLRKKLNFNVFYVGNNTAAFKESIIAVTAILPHLKQDLLSET